MNRLLTGGAVFLLFVLLLGRAMDQEAAGGLREGASLRVPVVGLRASASATERSAASPSRSLHVSGREAVRRVFGGNARAQRVAYCESKYDVRAVSATNDHGLFQLNRPTWDPARNPRARPYWPRGKDWRHVYDPVVNARVAWAISRRGTDFWTHWRWSAGCWA